MKSFTFLDGEYQDLNSLGVAFSEHFKSALNAIQDKKFVKFIKKFKSQRDVCVKALYDSKYLQSALSILIYHMTTEHLFVLGGKKYEDLFEMINHIEDDKNVHLFLLDKGIRNTVLPTIEDEKLKMNWVALEEHPNDQTALNFIKNYKAYDSIETMETIFSELFTSSEERFGKAFRLLKEENVLLCLAHHYSLKEMTELKQHNCPIFYAFTLLQSDFKEEDLFAIAEENFCLFTLENLNNYKGKKTAKSFLKRYKKMYKEYLKTKKAYLDKKKNYTFECMMKTEEQLYEYYLRMVDYSSKGLISCKKEKDSFALTKPYLNTLVSEAYLEGKTFTLDEEENTETSNMPIEYFLPKLRKAVKNHSAFATVMIVLALFAVIYFGVFFALFKFIDSFNLLSFRDSVSAIFTMPALIFLICFLALSLFVAIFILIVNKIAKKRYYKLCKLAYYRKNESLLVTKDFEEYDKLKALEEKYAKSIDRYYRFYGAVGMLFLSILFSLVGLSVMMAIMGDDLSLDDMTLLYTNYLLYVPSLVVAVIGCLRHKKTSWSVLFAVIMGLAIGVGFYYLKMMM